MHCPGLILEFIEDARFNPFLGGFDGKQLFNEPVSILIDHLLSKCGCCYDLRKLLRRLLRSCKSNERRIYL